LEEAGYDVAVAADHDEWACQTHGHNSNALVSCRDLDDADQTRAWLKSLELPPVALIAGGFPCQPYSRAGHSRIRHLVATGRRSDVDSRTHSWLTWVAAIDELRPERALAENVPDLVRFNGGRQLADIVGAVEDLGYEVDVRILPTRLYGVPQYRERLLIQAVRQGEVIVWPEPEGEPDDTLRGAIGDLPAISAGHQKEPIPYEPSRRAPVWARAGIPAGSQHLLFDHIARDVRADDLQAYEQLPQGGTYLDVPVELRRYDDNSFTDKYKRLRWDSPSRTITAHIARDGYWYIHPDQHRTLSVREAARVQTFPDWYRFAGFPSNRLGQIGNAVPPLMARALGRAMLNPQAQSVSISRTPGAVELLRDVLADDWEPMDQWQVLVREVLFGGRAGDERVEQFLRMFPQPSVAAARLDEPGNSHEDRAHKLALALLDVGGALPPDFAESQHAVGASRATARLVSSMIHGGEPPRSSGTLRLAERVAGVRRNGSLNGVAGVALARLADFGADPALNQLLVDLSRFVCVRAKPKCSSCPLETSCTYAIEGEPDGGIEGRLQDSLALF
jgi:DNA (cytosine-5)-methyltransferase 1